ncbi:MAG TPA: bifunctional phosphoribosylaminoimidazolecarboxamide formyltransferase/IMP cyclohydrolase [Acidimicrobiia bacterium]|nr:bifunctional phosphoribosylaminoimidazolecarboxamide formyltransferase/IMP cyclohydrolase [Acidimicrobiia bacterium]
MTKVPVKRALISVHDKEGLVPFAQRLEKAGVEIVSSGGTHRTLVGAGVTVTRVEDVTGAPEMLGGRVKTLHPHIHGGVLADLANPDHRQDLKERDIEPFQLVVVNLYPFEDTVAKPEATESDVIEEIDIGGPAMMRAAAKNHAWVGVVTGPDQYGEVAAAVEAGGLDADLRRRLAARAFFRTASYDAAIVSWFHPEQLPPRMVIPLERWQALRYGENPHQPGASYIQRGSDAWWAKADLVQGKEMSFNNHLDAEAAWRLVNRFDDAAAVIVKHTNPCGVAVAGSVSEAYDRAWECDPLSAFGGVVGVNRTVDVPTAEQIVANFVEVVVAPAIEVSARPILGTKPNLRVLSAPRPTGADLDIRRMEGGFVAQVRDEPADDEWKTVSSRSPDELEMAQLRFAWKVAAATKSNAIVVARDGAAVGVGAGDQSRVGAAERALARAGDRARGAVAASDAFFPFSDGLEALAAAGVTAVVEPGGSRGDAAVIAAADAAGVALVFTGRRHFLH